jgi:enoyl-[acyl-carrier protein] reductase II
MLGKGRSKRGIFEGDMSDGELEIGQVAAMIDTIEPVADIIKRLVVEFNATSKKMKALQF